MALPLKPPIKPQLALSRTVLPEGEGWAYEPKYDGFRAIVYVDGDDVYMQSRGGKPLRRYFPEFDSPRAATCSTASWSSWTPTGGRSSMRSEPAASGRIAGAHARRADARASGPSTCSPKTDRSSSKPFADRRAALEEMIAAAPGRKKTASGSVEVTPLTTSPKKAEPWLLSGEGVIAKELGAMYKPGQRKGMVKVKRVRTIDCVVMGWRPGKHEGTVGSLILGLYDNASLRPIGHTSGLKAKEKEGVGEDARRI